MPSYLKNSAKYFLPIIAVGILGCNDIETRTELSDVLEERGVVSQKQHIDASSSLIPVTAGEGIIVNIPQTTPEENYITFNSQVSFRLDNKKLYNRFKLNEPVRIKFRKVFTRYYQDQDHDGKNDLTIRTISGYQFVDARSIK
jgi:hypothetical protein